MLVAQITDPHVLAQGETFRGRIDTAAWLARAVDAINGFRPAIGCVLLTGDCVDAGLPAQYANLAGVLARLRMPLLAVPGNHDARAPFLAAFPAVAARVGDFPFVQYVADEFPVRLVGLDTLDEGAPGGRLCERRLDWLDATLAADARKPTVVFMHHPPFACGIAGMDAQRLAAPEKLAAILARRSNIERVVAGHLHRAIEVRFAGTIAATAPATAHQVGLALSSETPFGFTLEPPGFRVLRWSPTDGMTSHLATHAPFDGPFDWDDGSGLIS